MKDNTKSFLTALTKEASNLGLDISKYHVDHIAYSASSPKNYEKVRTIFLKLGKLIREVIISNRRVGVIKLSKPVRWNSQNINAVEIIEPVKGEDKRPEWEHAELLVNNFDDLIAKHPGLNWDLKAKDREKFARIKIVLPSGKEVKFLKSPILEEV